MTPTDSTPSAPGTGYATQFQTQNIAPPNSIYISLDDSLFFYCVPSVVCTLRIGLRYLLPTGEIKVGEYDLTTAATRSPQVMIQSLGEGFILGINVFCLTQPLRRGQVWVKFVLQRGGINVQQLTQTICQGYVTEYTSLFWPSAQTDYEFSGYGNLRSVTGTTPGAGADISESVPAGAIWKLHSFHYNLTTSAAGVNRTLLLYMDDGTNRLIELFAVAQVPPASAYSIFWEMIPTVGVSNLSNMINPLPNPVFLPAGFRIRTQTINIDVADQYAGVQYLVEEWLQP